MSATDVCRLCSVKENLVWLFDKTLGNNKNMSEVVFITTGVEVHVYDIVSQNICKQCLQTTTNMFEFRKQSLENDKRLKDKCAQYLKDNGMIIPNTDIVLKTEDYQVMKQPKETYKPTIKMHTSIKDLYQMYPRIKLPTICLNCHVAPVVCMPMNEVEEYFKSRNMNLNEYTKTLRFKNTNLKIPKKSENKTNNVIPPIKIKLTSSNSTYEIINSSTNKDVNVQRANTNSIKESKHSLELDALKKISHRKRKLSEESSKTEYNKATLIASLGLLPKLNVNTSTTSAENAITSSDPDKSASQYVCNICNAVRYNTKDFRKHQNKHLRCQFCRTKFRTVETKMQHVDNCVIKNVINNLPYIEIDKIENDVQVRKTYPTTFSDFPPLVACDSLDNFKHSEVAGNLAVVEPSEEGDITDLTNKKMPVTTENTIKVECDGVDSSVMPTHEVKNGYVKNKTEVHASLTSTSYVTNKVSQQNVTTNKISVVKPNVKIKYDSVLEKLDAKSSDINLLKNLLTNYKSLKLLRDKSTQAEIPIDRKVILHSQDISAEFTDLQQLMHVYPIPVDVNNGSFDISFNDNPTSLKQPKKMHLWNDLTPIEIKTDNTNISDSNSRTDGDLESKLDHQNNNSVSEPPNHNISTEHQFTTKSSFVTSDHFNGNDISNTFQNTCDISCINTDKDPLPNAFPGIIRVKKMSELV